MFDLGIEKIAILGLLAMFLIGPDKLPKYAAQLGKWVRTLRGMADEAKARMKTEMGPEFDDVDWEKLDPRRYHPRQILRDAWNSEQSSESAPMQTDAETAEPEPQPEPVPVPVETDRSDWRSMAFPFESTPTTDGDPAVPVPTRASLAVDPAGEPDRYVTQ